MNEPNIQSPTQWKATAVAAINAIRAVSTTQTILIPGHLFHEQRRPGLRTETARPGRAIRIRPAARLCSKCKHQYLDQNTLVAHLSDCVPGYGSSVLTSTTAWLAANGYKAFLGEFDWYNDFGQSGGVVSPQCQAEGTALLNAMQFSPNQSAGWTWWGSGPWAWNNGVNLDPGADGHPGDQPQTPTLIQMLTSPLRSGGIANGGFRNARDKSLRL